MLSGLTPNSAKAETTASRTASIDFPLVTELRSVSSHASSAASTYQPGITARRHDRLRRAALLATISYMSRSSVSLYEPRFVDRLCWTAKTFSSLTFVSRSQAYALTTV